MLTACLQQSWHHAGDDRHSVMLRVVVLSSLQPSVVVKVLIMVLVFACSYTGDDPLCS